MPTLHFPIRTVCRLIIHSLESPERAPTFSQLFDGRYRFDRTTIDPRDEAQPPDHALVSRLVKVYRRSA